jgi:hypothetical protein
MACDGRVRRTCSCADVDWKESCLGDFRLPLLAVVRLSGVRDHALGVCSVADIMYFRKSPGQAFLLSTQLLVVVRRESLVPDVGPPCLLVCYRGMRMAISTVSMEEQ